MRVRLPLDTFVRFTTNRKENTMSNDNKNNLPLTHADGTVNGDNPRVCAAMVDGMGMILTHVMRDLKDRPDILALMDDNTKADLDTVFRTMQLLRNSIGVNEDWYNENQHELVAKIYAEADAKRKSFSASIVKAMIDAGLPLDMIPPELRPKPSAADAADALLDSLRADGVIG